MWGRRRRSGSRRWRNRKESPKHRKQRGLASSWGYGDIARIFSTQEALTLMLPITIKTNFKNFFNANQFLVIKVTFLLHGRILDTLKTVAEDCGWLFDSDISSVVSHLGC